MLGNAIKQTTTSTGTGPLALVVAAGYPAFSDSFTAGATGAPFYYSVLDSTGAPVELGIGHLSDATTLVRDRVLATYVGGVYTKNSPSPVSLTPGTYTVICGSEAGAAMLAAPGVSNNPSLGVGKRVASAHLTVGNSSSTGVTLTANRLYITPFQLGVNMECNSLVARVGTGVASGNMRLGLYRCGADGFPADLIAQTAALSCATSGVDVSGSITPVKLVPGWYFTAMASDGAPAVGRLDGGTHLPNPLGQLSFNCITEAAGFWAAFAFGVLPAVAPTTSLTLIGGAGIPAVVLGAV